MLTRPYSSRNARAPSAAIRACESCRTTRWTTIRRWTCSWCPAATAPAARYPTPRSPTGSAKPPPPPHGPPASAPGRCSCTRQARHAVAMWPPTTPSKTPSKPAVMSPWSAMPAERQRRPHLPHLQPEQEEEPTGSPAPFLLPGRGLDYFSYYQDHCVSSRSRVTVASLEVAGAGDVPVARGMASSRPAARGPDRVRGAARAAVRAAAPSPCAERPVPAEDDRACHRVHRPG